MHTLRIATLNMWHSNHDIHERIEVASSWLNDAALDVICLQEVADIGNQGSAVLLAEQAGWHLATPVHHQGVRLQTAVLVRDSSHVRQPGEAIALYNPAYPFAAAAWLETIAGPLLVVSVHLSWGGENEHMRLAEAKRIVAWIDGRLGADDIDAAVMAGDFNAPPDSDTLRWLTGRAASTPGTYWTDAWVRNTGGDGSTSAASNPYARHTAYSYSRGSNPVLDAHLLPDRRIDFILSRGWRHGRPFSPLHTRVVREPLMSDHYAVVTELLLTL
jgi:endonuclease/exonuclease/phosphatase family metal-dependent hydrolase